MSRVFWGMHTYEDTTPSWLDRVNRPGCGTPEARQVQERFNVVKAISTRSPLPGYDFRMASSQIMYHFHYLR